MIPDPTTAASSRAVPTPSAAVRRRSGGIDCVPFPWSIKLSFLSCFGTIIAWANIGHGQGAGQLNVQGVLGSHPAANPSSASRRRACVGDLVKILGVPQPTASRHLAYLRRAGLV